MSSRTGYRATPSCQYLNTRTHLQVRLCERSVLVPATGCCVQVPVAPLFSPFLNAASTPSCHQSGAATLSVPLH